MFLDILEHKIFFKLAGPLGTGRIQTHSDPLIIKPSQRNRSTQYSLQMMSENRLFYMTNINYLNKNTFFRTFALW